jgi:hypothetical protein
MQSFDSGNADSTSASNSCNVEPTWNFLSKDVSKDGASSGIHSILPRTSYSTSKRFRDESDSNPKHTVERSDQLGNRNDDCNIENVTHSTPAAVPRPSIYWNSIAPKTKVDAKPNSKNGSRLLNLFSSNQRKDSTVETQDTHVESTPQVSVTPTTSEPSEISSLKSFAAKNMNHDSATNSDYPLKHVTKVNNIDSDLTDPSVSYRGSDLLNTDTNIFDSVSHNQTIAWPSNLNVNTCNDDGSIPNSVMSPSLFAPSDDKQVHQDGPAITDDTSLSASSSCVTLIPRMELISIPQTISVDIALIVAPHVECVLKRVCCDHICS